MILSAASSDYICFGFGNSPHFSGSGSIGKRFGRGFRCGPWGFIALICGCNLSFIISSLEMICEIL